MTYKHVVMVLAMILVITFGVITIVMLSNKDSCSYGSKVDKIGGCDRDGKCGVAYTDGRKSTLYYPVVGELCNAEK